MDGHACDYRALLEQTPAITYLADFGEDYTLRYISPQVEKLLGFPPADWLGSPMFWVERLRPDDRERVLAEAESAIAEIGLGLAIDDFGAGFSSLGRLEQMPVDILKIDRSFLSRLDTDGRGAAIVGTIVQLADALGMVAVAEGIETEAQRALLVERGCRLGQGYLLARPMPAPALTALLAGEQPATSAWST